MDMALDKKIKQLRGTQGRAEKYAPEGKDGMEARALRALGEDSKRLADWLEELKCYKKLEERGRLVVLPCEIGDTVYDCDLGRITPYIITGYSFGAAEGYIDEPVSCDQIVFYYSNGSGSITGSFAESVIGAGMFFAYEDAEAELERKQVETNGSETDFI